MIYHERKFYSPEWDGWYVRLSTVNTPPPSHNPGEYFMILPWDGGKKWREQRLRGLELLQEAIEQGYDPGEVLLDDDDRPYVYDREAEWA
jgi:hypothetical protein